jgi:hypothetical protein
MIGNAWLLPMRSLSLRSVVTVGAMALFAMPACSSNSNRPKPVGEVAGGSAGTGTGGASGNAGASTGGTGTGGTSTGGTGTGGTGTGGTGTGGSSASGGSSGAATGGSSGSATGGSGTGGSSGASGAAGAGTGGTGTGGTGTGGTSGSGGSQGSGGTGTGGSAGSQGSGGSGTGGTGGTGTGGTGTGGTGTGGSGGVGGSQCVNETVVGFGTKDLIPTDPTPAAFADAYKAEVASMSDPGPMLIVLKFTSPVDSWFGSLVPNGSSGDYEFGETPAEVPITLSPAFSLSVPSTQVQFSLHFDTSDTHADIPVIAVQAGGILSTACDSIGFDYLYLAIPASAGNIAFHGSTVGALMGPPSGGQNGNPSGWPIGFIGGAKAVSYQGGIP